MDNLGDDLRIEILLRLPVKSLACLKCVSKSWLSFISDPKFSKLHFQQSSQFYTTRFSYFVNTLGFPYYLFRTHNQMRCISVNDNSDALRLDFPSDCNAVVLASCRGFQLLQHKEKDKLLVWNPLTGERRQILLPRTHICHELLGFCYDESSDDYLIVIASHHEGCQVLWFQVFSIRTNSWNKQFFFNCPDSILVGHPKPGSVVNGVIHWFPLFLETRPLPQPPHPLVPWPAKKLIALDIKTNQPRQVPKPDNIGDISRRCRLSVFGEWLALIDFRDYSKTEVWVMKEYGVKSSWTKLMSIPHPPKEIDIHFSPFCLTKDGQLVMAHSLSLSKWSEQGKLEDKRCDGHLYYSLYVPYTETLLSLP